MWYDVGVLSTKTLHSDDRTLTPSGSGRQLGLDFLAGCYGVDST